MAESRFKGLSILMNMRDVGIERTMKQIRAQFKTLDSEMRDLMLISSTQRKHAVLCNKNERIN